MHLITLKCTVTTLRISGGRISATSFSRTPKAKIFGFLKSPHHSLFLPFNIHIFYVTFLVHLKLVKDYSVPCVVDMESQ